MLTTLGDLCNIDIVKVEVKEMKTPVLFKIKCLKNQIGACLREIAKGVKKYILDLCDLEQQLEKAKAMSQLTEKQVKAWEERREFIGDSYKVIFDGEANVSGFFNSPCGEYVDNFNFRYNPIEQTETDMDGYWDDELGCQVHPKGHGWLWVGAGDNWGTVKIPAFKHPNELYQWLRQQFGYPEVHIRRAA